MNKQNNNNIRVIITKDERPQSNWLHGIITGGFNFEAKIYDVGSVFGIDGGRISKLGIYRNGERFVGYDRGWDMEPQTTESKVIFERLMTKLNSLDEAFNADKPKDLLGKIESNKGKVSHNRSYAVTIYETLKKTVEVEAASREEAEQFVSDKWRNSGYILGADNFDCVEFNTEPVKREKARGETIE
jgi:hypothetical protein